MNNNEKITEAQIHEAMVESETNKHWKKIAEERMAEKRKELEQEMEKLNNLEEAFRQEKNIKWTESVEYIDKIKQIG